MSFNIKHLPEVEILKKIRSQYSSDEEFLDQYLRKVDAIQGSQESFKFLDEIRKKVNENEQGLGTGS